ncbi:ORF5 [Alphabaculovirus altermyunipunctae]|uniref:ORF5 n=1 Tax=Mythimna unipuncta nucleopolyhedrovirus TaxID=447897 RepID=A0A346TPE2_9ABAC|nr:ORF5 [Mythimna unipuncta nucleopolyhedrovirus]AXU41452.1 ORF5 [Mythimna unipuncta nucleopolyhedrovirus]
MVLVNKLLLNCNKNNVVKLYYFVTNKILLINFINLFGFYLLYVFVCMWSCSLFIYISNCLFVRRILNCSGAQQNRRHWVGTCLPIPLIRSTTKWKTWPPSDVILINGLTAASSLLLLLLLLSIK